MTDILPTVWHAEEHTLAKHSILRRYVEAWFPILSSVRGASREILYIDGFAGPGEYVEGEPGSPIIALKAALLHSRAFPRPVRLIFIEEREDRVSHLASVLSRYRDEIEHSKNVKVDPPMPGECDVVLADLIDRYEKEGIRFGPALAFLDQFGYSAVSLDLIRRIMQYPQCEVFSYLDYRDMNRWISDPNKAPAFTRTYGGEQWRGAIPLRDSRRREFLLNTYKKTLREQAGVSHVQSFSMFDRDGVLLYWLLFCTNNLRGLEEMKRAMWSVDKSGKFRFSDKDQPGQLRLLEDEFSQEWLAGELARNFGGQTITVEDAKIYTLESTPCYLFKEALMSLYRRGELEVPNPPAGWRKGTFPNEEMSISFRQGTLF